jgi:tRNA-2-methylthio-N6-dimethylallyladenosine synthase
MEEKMDEILNQKKYIEKIKQLNQNKKLKYYILTMGCQLNENDSEKLCGMIEDMGYCESKDLNDADLYIINTCCVRENAEEKVFGKLRGIKNNKKE